MALGGAGALAAGSIKSVETVAFPELGCESVKRVVFDRFPLYIGLDIQGGDIFQRHSRPL